MSKDNHLTLSYVFKQWKDIELHLSTVANSSSFFAFDLQQFMAHKQGKPWKAQFDQQVILIYVAAFFLHSHYFNSEITLHSQDQIHEIL
jgi:hypothetical protein